MNKPLKKNLIKITFAIVIVSLMLPTSMAVASAQLKIYNGTVSPIEGEEGDIFVYSVNYTNPSGEPIKYFERPINITPRMFNDEHPRKAIDSRGNVHLVWMSNRDGPWEIYYKEITKNGLVLVNDTRISDMVCNSSSVYPSIAIDSEDYSHVVWANNRNGTWEIYYSKVAPWLELTEIPNNWPDLTVPDIRISTICAHDSGRVVFPEVDDKNATYIEHPDIDVDSQDNVHIVWSDKRDGQWEVYYQMQDNNATPTVLINDTRISDPTTSLDGDTSNSMSPVIAAGPQDPVSKSIVPRIPVHIAWQDERDDAGNGKNWEIWYEQINPYADDMDGDAATDTFPFAVV
ncbi:MAG: hypothetical protein ACE5J3_07375, partial [Methanosarcinales archaeon]